jgi:uncharacterized repeat protein (TIGR03803 family)
VKPQLESVRQQRLQHQEQLRIAWIAGRLGLDGKFYGTTPGNIFRISASGVLETLHTFSAIPDGGNALTGLIQGSDCNFYGNTLGGGPTPSSDGTVFRITPGGVYTVLYSFGRSAAGWSLKAPL